MSYLGQVELKSSEIRRIDVTSSTSATHTLTWTPPSEQSLIVTINGIKQQNNYTISGTTLTLDSALVSTDELEVVGILDIGVTNIPADDSITTAMVKDDAVTADKLADAINTSIAANTAKVTNATHTGDVTGATALTIAVDAVDIAMLSATGTADGTTFLRGDNAWATPSGGKVLQVVSATKTDTYSSTSTSFVDITGLTLAITPVATTSKILILASIITSQSSYAANYCKFRLSRGGTAIAIADADGSRPVQTNVDFPPDTWSMSDVGFNFLDSPSTTSSVTYAIQGSVKSGTLYINRSNSDPDTVDGQRGVSTITLMEIGA
jgi:hypothetical protein